MTRRVSRRQFLHRAAAVGFGLPLVVPARALAAPGRPGANDRIGIAYVGAGRRANQLMRLPPRGASLLPRISTCHAPKRSPRSNRVEHTTITVNCLMRKTSTPYSSPPPITGTPLPAIQACQAGKDVYLEKPLSLTIREGRVLVGRRAQVSTSAADWKPTPFDERASAGMRTGAQWSGWQNPHGDHPQLSQSVGVAFAAA